MYLNYNIIRVHKENSDTPAALFTTKHALQMFRKYLGSRGYISETKSEY